MDVLWASRLQFAVAAFFHFIFVPLTLGLSVLTAIYETLYLKTGDEDYKRAAKFWGKVNQKKLAPKLGCPFVILVSGLQVKGLVNGRKDRKPQGQRDKNEMKKSGYGKL